MSSSGVSSGPPGSNNIGSIGGRAGGIRGRSSSTSGPPGGGQRGSLEQPRNDSGFGGATLLPGGGATPTTTDAVMAGAGGARGMPLDVRWLELEPGPLYYQDADELTLLLELIQAKSERLRSEAVVSSHLGANGASELLDPDSRASRRLQAINEESKAGIPGLDVPVGSEVDLLRRENVLLMNRVSELESAQGTGGAGLDQAQSGDSESSVSGIVHSVHIRTGEDGTQQPNSSSSVTAITTTTTTPGVPAGGSGIPGGARPPRASRSVSHSDLLTADSNQVEPHHKRGSSASSGGPGVQIEIKGSNHHLSRSQDHLAPSARHVQTRPGLKRPPSASNHGGVSVVSLKHGASVDSNLPQRSASESAGRMSVSGTGRYLPRQAFGQPTKSHLLTSSHRTGGLLPGRMVLGKSGASRGPPPVTAAPSAHMKSKSVENLMDPANPAFLGLKAANSEMNVGTGSNGGSTNNGAAGSGQFGRRRLSGTTSELNVSRLGTSEKLKVFEAVEGVVSMPAELTRGLRGRSARSVRPNRDKIRTVLGMSNVIELQRQLLTSVMENEVST